MELVRVDRREVLLGPQARDVDGVLAVGEDLLVLPCAGLALAPRVRRTLREPRGAALVVLPLVALGRGPVFSKSERAALTPSTRRRHLLRRRRARQRRNELLVLGLGYFVGSLRVLLRWTTEAH